MRTKHICVMIHIRIKSPVGTVNQVYALQYFCWPFLGDTSFVDPFLLFMFHVGLCFAVLSVSCSLVIPRSARAGLLAHSCVVFCVLLSLSHMVSRIRCGT